MAKPKYQESYDFLESLNVPYVKARPIDKHTFVGGRYQIVLRYGNRTHTVLLHYDPKRTLSDIKSLIRKLSHERNGTIPAHDSQGRGDDPAGAHESPPQSVPG